MKASALWFSGAILAIASVVFTTPATAHADTYKLFNLGYGYRTDLIGITASGTVVLDAGPGICGYDTTNCYETWINGAEVNRSPEKPDFTYDNGTPCQAPPGFSDVITSVCNNGRQVFGTGVFATPPYRGTFDGPDPFTDRISAGGILDEVRLNSSGDFASVVNEGFSGPNADGEIYQAIDLTSDVPEPASIFLLGTGALAALGSMRRRLFQ